MGVQARTVYFYLMPTYQRRIASRKSNPDRVIQVVKLKGLHIEFTSRCSYAVTAVLPLRQPGWRRRGRSFGQDYHLPVLRPQVRVRLGPVRLAAVPMRRPQICLLPR